MKLWKQNEDKRPNEIELSLLISSKCMKMIFLINNRSNSGFQLLATSGSVPNAKNDIRKQDVRPGATTGTDFSRSKNAQVSEDHNWNCYIDILWLTSKQRYQRLRRWMKRKFKSRLIPCVRMDVWEIFFQERHKLILGPNLKLDQIFFLISCHFSL